MHGNAAMPAIEGENVMDWIRRQSNPVKPAMPVKGITQPQPSRATVSAMVDAIDEKTGRADTRPVQNKSLGEDRS